MPRILTPLVALLLLFTSTASAQLVAGPDPYGYRAVETDFDFVELGDGLGTILIPDFSNYKEIVFPWTFSWYGLDYSSVWVGAMGSLDFTNTVYLNSPANCPMTWTYMPDLLPLQQSYGSIHTPGGSVYEWYDLAEDRVIISWETVSAYNQGPHGDFSFQVHIYPDGQLEYHYLVVDIGNPIFDGGADAVIGWQDHSGGSNAVGNSTLIGCEEHVIEDETAVAITACADADGDGYLDPACGHDDCDEGDAAVNPGMPEICNGFDDDCDPTSLEAVDSDGDGATACEGDCDNGDPNTYPGAPELCDGIDNDCNTVVDDAPDGDGDSWLPCDGDCDDTDADVNPDAVEICDGVDTNCDVWLLDAFPRGHEPPTGSPTVGLSTGRYGLQFEPDEDIAITGFEMMFSNNQTGYAPFIIYEGTDPAGPFERIFQQTTQVGGGSEFWDGFDDASIVLLADRSYVFMVNKGSGGWALPHVVDGLPHAIPEGTFTTSWVSTGTSIPDPLVDNFGANLAWGIRFNYASEDDPDGDGAPGCSGDCAPDDPTIFGGAPELCNELDDDCDNEVPLDETDVDNDGYLGCDDDCDDDNQFINPSESEVCDLADTDCDGLIPWDETTDVDGDGTMSCQDCNDSDPEVNPDQPELCDGVDTDCDGDLGDGTQSYTSGANSVFLTQYTDTFVGGIFAPTHDTQISTIEVWAECEIGTPLTWMVYEATAIDGDYTQIASWESTSGFTEEEFFHTSPGWIVPLTAGRFYAAGVWAPGENGFSTRPNYFLPNGADELPGVGGANYTSASPLTDPVDLYDPDNTWRVLIYVPADTDDDGDGSIACDDCDDTNPDAYPGAPEACDAFDTDCDLTVPADEVDGDGDGSLACDDCDDADASVYPGAVEVCDGVDADCDGVGADESLDGDGDGEPQCTDCDDANADVFPGAPELCNDAIEDCGGPGADGAELSRPPSEPLAWESDANLAIVEVTENTFLREIQVHAAFDGPSPGAWLVYEGTSTSGPFDYLEEIPAELPNSPQAQWHSSPALSVPLEAGTVYAIGLVVDEPGYGPVWTDSDTATASVSWGDLFDETALIGAGNRPATIPWNWISNATAAVRLTANSESDGDGDGAMLCDDCDDDDDAVHPAATEVAYNGIDDDCDPATADDDIDGDGSLTSDDCDDNDATRYPGADEGCDGIDNDCDGAADPSEIDDDGDGTAECEGDCDDADSSIHPAASEACNGIDDDCDGAPGTDEGDGDGDGTLECADCDDDDPDRAPTLTEVCDGVDNDCDGSSAGEADDDGDGYRACEECDDSDEDVSPEGEEVCDGIDNDCDPGTDEDGDEDEDGETVCDGDCDDDDDDIYPGSTELCDGLDNDCDPSTDENIDNDGDGASACAEDCDDTNPDVGPHALEECDGLDTNCDGTTPSNEDDDDLDGQAPCAGDCNDSDPDTYEGAPELCDGVDNNCNGSTKDEGVDADGDGFMPCTGDCDDTNPDSNPDAAEVCDGSDNDCDGAIPPEEADEDGDGSYACGDDCDDEDPDVGGGALENTEQACNDGIDNDCDELVDQAEPDCSEFHDFGGDEPRDRGCTCSSGSSSAGILMLLLPLFVRRRR